MLDIYILSHNLLIPLTQFNEINLSVEIVVLLILHLSLPDEFIPALSSTRIIVKVNLKIGVYAKLQKSSNSIQLGLILKNDLLFSLCLGLIKSESY